MGNGPQYTLAQLNSDGVVEAIGPDNPLYIEGGGGGGGSAFPAESPDGTIEANLTDGGFTVDSAGLDFLASPARFAVTSASGSTQPISIDTVGENVFVQISSEGPVGFVALAGAVNAYVPIAQAAGSATLPAHLVTKGYVDAKVPTPPASGNFRLASTNGVISWVAA